MNLNSPRTPKSRKRLDIGQKLEIIEFADKHANDKTMTQIKIVDIFTRKFELESPLSNRTENEILHKQRKELIKVDLFNSKDSNSKKNLSEAKYPELEKCLFIWHLKFQ